jgi:radical SAM protein with 4Fe4S-binding SPASM domain
MNLKYILKEAKYYMAIEGGLKRIFFKFLFSRTILKKIVNSKFYNFIYCRIIFKKEKRFRPYIISIENTNICNAKCIMCPHKKMKRNQKTMPQKDFEIIINKIMKSEKIKYIMFTGLGEPLCDKELEKKIEFLNKNYNLHIILFSNAALMDMQRAENLLKLKILKVNFSFNGPEEDYNKNMGLDYNNSLRNILYFLKRKKELGLKKPLINISSMILYNNPDKYQRLYNYWINKADSVVISTPSNWSGQLDSRIVRKSFKDKRWPCMNLWKDIAIDSAGNVVTCHGDFESRFKLGNLINDDYEKIKFNKSNLRKKHLAGDFSASICSKCEASFDSSLDWWE